MATGNDNEQIWSAICSDSQAAEVRSEAETEINTVMVAVLCVCECVYGGG